MEEKQKKTNKKVAAIILALSIILFILAGVLPKILVGTDVNYYDYDMFDVTSAKMEFEIYTKENIDVDSAIIEIRHGDSLKVESFNLEYIDKEDDKYEFRLDVIKNDIDFIEKVVNVQARTYDGKIIDFNKKGLFSDFENNTEKILITSILSFMGVTTLIVALTLFFGKVHAKEVYNDGLSVEYILTDVNPEPPKKEEPTTITCKYCGIENKIANAKCKYCGAPLIKKKKKKKTDE